MGFRTFYQTFKFKKRIKIFHTPFRDFLKNLCAQKTLLIKYLNLKILHTSFRDFYSFFKLLVFFFKKCPKTLTLLYYYNNFCY